MLKEIKRKKIKNENNYVKESLGLEMKREDSWKDMNYNHMRSQIKIREKPVIRIRSQIWNER